ncbi:MAG: SpoIIE family protein phosphatase [Labilithrix sp.]|nr:SpoIIE family protein phosphatase [Labilithrix sp.]
MSGSAAVNLDPVLVRQLKKAGLLEPANAPSAEVWAKFLAAVNDHYRHLNEDRALLTRSMELSTNEMEELRRRVEGQRDQLSAIVDAIAEALGLFGGIVQTDQDGQSVVTGLEYAKDEFRARLSVLFSDEASDSQQVSGIRTNLVRLADQLISLLAETAERASVKKELEVARAVQNLLVPAEDLMERPFLRIAGHFEPASECGGDWWGVYDLPDGRVLTIVGDATGHGISSAIITGAAKAACDLACNVTQGRLSPSDLLKMMNAAIHDTARRQIMMTCAAGLFDPRTRTLTVANAGHHFPYHVRAGQLRPIMVHGQPLGASSGSTYESTTVTFAGDDLFVWYTDGIVECEDDRGEQFSEKKLRAVCQRTAPGGARAVRDAVVEAVASFRKPGSQGDDMTLVVASIT